jgi:hypothetical protein
MDPIEDWEVDPFPIHLFPSAFLLMHLTYQNKVGAIYVLLIL